MQVLRFEVFVKKEFDQEWSAIYSLAEKGGYKGLKSISSSKIYLLGGSLTESEIKEVKNLFRDPVTEIIVDGSRPVIGELIEIHGKPGVMDPAAESIEEAIEALLGKRYSVRTGLRWDIEGLSKSESIKFANDFLLNSVVQDVYTNPYHPEIFPQAPLRHFESSEINITQLSSEGLLKLSRDNHLFLSLEEMMAIKDYYKNKGREPKGIELETLAQTWSEHCLHKTFKSNYLFTGDLPDPPQNVGYRLGFEQKNGDWYINNLLKSTVVAATNRLIDEGLDWCLSVFVDNAGIIKFDDELAVCFKVETHNHPSAIEPYGGSATGIGGCIRDIIGCGLAAKPIASTDVFCVGSLGAEKNMPSGCLPPSRILSEVVRGVRDYGNRMGIPTINGNVWFDDQYVGNPLVYCGCVGVMPNKLVEGEPQFGDLIVCIGGRTGRDGIHGATFSSAELTDTCADEFSHAVQIGNPITEKVALDTILEARDHRNGPIFNAITDCGAGGFSSAIGEMGEVLGATVHLEKALLKYNGLSPDEIWISEAQERMILSVPKDKIELLESICKKHGSEMSILGNFGTQNSELILNYNNNLLGKLDGNFLHKGFERPIKKATWKSENNKGTQNKNSRPSATETLKKLLNHPNITSKQKIIRQYDHEVQGRSVIGPTVGNQGIGPSDAAVILPNLKSNKGLAISNGLATGSQKNPYKMGLMAIDECVRNLVCVGADPKKIALLDNFCWPGVEDSDSLGALVLASVACYDASVAFRAPFISGKDSLNNQFVTEAGEKICIPYTLLISGCSTVENVDLCLTMDLKKPGNILLLIGETTSNAGGSHIQVYLDMEVKDAEIPLVDLCKAPLLAEKVHQVINKGLIRSAHDLSEGGLLVAASEMAIASEYGLDLNLEKLSAKLNGDTWLSGFVETPSRYLIEVEPENIDAVLPILNPFCCIQVGEVIKEQIFKESSLSINVSVDSLRQKFEGGLPWV